MEHESTTPVPAKESLDQAPKQVARVHRTRIKKLLASSIFKRYRKAWILFALFIIIGAIAALIYPSRPAIYRPQPFQIQVRASEKVTYLAVGVGKLSSGLFSLGIFIETTTPKHPQSKVYAQVSLQLPAPVTTESCKLSLGCSSDLVTEGLNAGQDDVEYSTDAFKPYPGGPGGPARSTIAQFVVAAPVFAWNENGLDVEAQLPAVQLLTYYPHQSLSDPTIMVGYRISGTAYDWAGGPAPSYVVRPPLYANSAAVWQLPVQQLVNPIPVSGTDSSTATWDSLLTFASGAFLGIAGGALVGAIQVALDAKWPDKSEPSGRAS